MDGDTGELIEVLIGTGGMLEIGTKLTKRSRGWFQREGEAYERNDVLLVEKMMWMDERVWPEMKNECCEKAGLWWSYADMKVWLS